MISMRVVLVVCASSMLLGAAAPISSAQTPPAPAMVDTPTVTVMTGLTVPEFEAEMQLMNQAP
jgi:hypothetical protein